MSNYDKLLSKLNELEDYFEYKDNISENVSKSNVGWQCYHILKAINIVTKAIRDSEPINYKRSHNKYKQKSFELNSFPRGVAKAPSVVLPPEIFSEKDLIEQLNFAKLNIEGFKTLDANSNFIHHIFGQLNKEETEIFLNIHTEHHLKIIRDILKTT